MNHLIRLLIGVSLVAVLLNGCGSKRFHADEIVYTEENMTQFYSEKKPIEQINEIDIDSLEGNVDIIASDGYYLEYSYYYIDNEPELKIEDNKLSFSDENMNAGSYSIKTKKKNYLKIYIPTYNEFHKISITQSSGDCSVGSFYSDAVDITNNYGDVYISNCQIGQLNTLQSSGKLTMEKDNLDNLDINNSYGEVSLSGISESVFPVKNIKITMSSGELNMSKVFSDIIDISNQYGDCSIDSSSIIKINGKMSSGNVDIGNTLLANIRLTNTYGNIKLLLLGTSDDYQFDVKSTYGTINIGTNTYVDGVTTNYGGLKEVTLNTTSGNIAIEFTE